MARRSRRRNKWLAEHPELDIERALGGSYTEQRWGETWQVRRVHGTKEYICPGCNQAITANTDHLVAFATGSLFGADAALAERRHWHVGCWRSGARPRL
jgi:hypothetical protein